MLLGLGLYIYAAGRMMPLLFALFVPLWFALDRGAIRRFWKPVGLMAAVSLFTAAPLLLYFWRYPYFLFFRSSYVATHGAGVVEGRPWLTRWYNLGRVLRGLFWQGETHFRHNLPARPLLDGVQSVLFALGFWAEGQRGRGAEEKNSAIRNPQSAIPTLFLLLWLAVMLLPSILSSDAPHFGRLSGAYPVLAIFIGRGAQFVVTTLAVQGQREGQRGRGHFPFSLSLVSIFFLPQHHPYYPRLFRPLRQLPPHANRFLRG
ncbi:MAG: hypothetical protein IPL28_02975 [Chloroflexi bacterium]|nr:hypothetical protein [Chloroflexota bacterium]